MKKQLLFLILIGSLIFQSCSKNDEIDQDAKEIIVRKTLIEFNKSAIKSGKYLDFVQKVNYKSSQQELTDEEIKTLIDEFLGEQTNDFIKVYNELVKLNLSTEEFYTIASQYKEVFDSNLKNQSQSACCTASENIPDNTTGSGWLGALMRVVCGCGDPDDSGNQDEDDEE